MHTQIYEVLILCIKTLESSKKTTVMLNIAEKKQKKLGKRRLASISSTSDESIGMNSLFIYLF